MKFTEMWEKLTEEEWDKLFNELDKNQDKCGASASLTRLADTPRPRRRSVSAACTVACHRSLGVPCDMTAQSSSSAIMILSCRCVLQVGDFSRVGGRAY